MYDVNQKKDIYASCKGKKWVAYNVNLTSVSECQNLNPKDQICKECVQTFNTKEKTCEASTAESRCNDDYHSNEKVPYEFALPDDYSVHTTRGVSLYIKNAINAASILSETSAAGPIDKDSYWYLLEAIQNEGEEGLMKVKTTVRDKLLALYDQSRTAFNATYGITLAWTLVVFLFIFRNVQSELAQETRHNRESKMINIHLLNYIVMLMVPEDILFRIKPIVEYIERIFLELTD